MHIARTEGMWKKRVKIGLLGSVLFVWIPSCSSGGLEEAALDPMDAQLDAQQEKWTANAPDEYVVRVCTQGFSQYQCTKEAVVAGRVNASKGWAATETGGYSWSELDPAQQPEPIARLFELAREIPREADCRPNDVRFDDEYGYVNSVVHLCFESWGERIECFLPGATDVEACGEPDRVTS